MIRFEQVSKSYVTPLRRRRIEALSGLSLEMTRGEVVGIAGPNGAGKSTMISILMGFLTPSAGTVTLDGLSPRRYAQANGVGYLTELVNLPPRWKVTEALRRLATLAGVPAAERGAKVDELIATLGLAEHADKRIKQLSKGNLQRVGLAQAMLGDFDVVVLDEPTHGLDPLWTQRFRDIVAGLRRPDRVILIASHNLDELELLADRVAILDHGRLQRIVAHSAERHDDALGWRVVFEGEVDVLAALPAAEAVAGRAGTWRVRASRGELSAALGRLLVGGAVLIECVPEQSRLESAFREAVQR